MGGYEKSPDYGGKKPTRWEAVAMIVLMIVVSGGYWWLRG